jgi:hypothetical protein
MDIQEQEVEEDSNEEEDEESMSLKDVIMTLNEFYANKLEHINKLVLIVKEGKRDMEGEVS